MLLKLCQAFLWVPIVHPYGNELNTIAANPVQLHDTIFRDHLVSASQLRMDGYDTSKCQESDIAMHLGNSNLTTADIAGAGSRPSALDNGDPSINPYGNTVQAIEASKIPECALPTNGIDSVAKQLADTTMALNDTDRPDEALATEVANQQHHNVFIDEFADICNHLADPGDMDISVTEDSDISMTETADTSLTEHNEDAGPNNIQRLSLQLRLRILDFIPHSQSRSSLSLTCHAFHDAVTHNHDVTDPVTNGATKDKVATTPTEAGIILAGTHDHGNTTEPSEDVKPSYIQTLPVELRILILSFISDMPSLANAALSCHAMYDVLTGKPDIIRSVLVNEVGLDVLPEAIQAHQCSPPFKRIQPVDPNMDGSSKKYRDQTRQSWLYISEYIQKMQREPVDSVTWTMSQAFELRNFHSDAVLKIVDHFIQACSESPYIPGNKALFSKTPASQTEKDRIARTLYRFEIYRRLFGILNLHDSRERKRLSYLFLAKFAPWENAQLATIYDFMAREVVSKFDDFAAHDVIWGKERTILDLHDKDWHIQYYLVLGLPRILKIATSKSFQDQEKAFRTKDMLVGHWFGFLNDSLMDLALRDANDRPDLFEAAPFFEEKDKGPQSIWRVSCFQSGWEDQDHAQLAIYDDLHWGHRHWGYIMWDRQRLDDIGAFEVPWELQDDRTGAEPTREEMQESWRARSEVYDRGGRGWWAPGDESRLEWREEWKVRCSHHPLRRSMWADKPEAPENKILDDDGTIRGDKGEWDADLV
ncbi:hypothetical protein F4778DRAFT_762890 [Xylariomycetidae sp. FL2044]|nr:hypothetical protein F4778DRAFT_762890 [Xylariomycetidae sp. FL2044]